MTRSTAQRLADLAHVRADAQRDANDPTLGPRERQTARKAVRDLDAAIAALRGK